LRPIAEQLPCLLAIEVLIGILDDSHVVNFTCCVVWFAFLWVSWALLPVSSVCA
jgi:hypothetical protein